MKKENNLITVLDIGSSKLTLLSGTEGINKTCVVIANAVEEYSGFMDAEFLEPSEIKEKIGNLMERVELASKQAITEVNIGVPAEFCISQVKKVTATFSSRKKLAPQLINEVYSQVFDDIENYTLNTVEPIYNILDNGKKLVEATNLKTTKISSLVNTIHVNNSFIELFNEILTELGVVKVNYLPVPLYEMKALGDLTSEACIIDIGYLTSSIAIGKGCGLVNLFSFSQGGAFVISDLMNDFSLTFNDACDLKKKIVLTMETTGGIVYDLSSQDNKKKILVKNANDCVKKRLDIFASVISQCLKKADVPNFLPIYLTGGGITQISGAKEYLSEKLGKNLGIISPNMSEFEKPYYFSSISLLQNLVKKQEKHFFLLANKNDE